MTSVSTRPLLFGNDDSDPNHLIGLLVSNQIDIADLDLGAAVDRFQRGRQERGINHIDCIVDFGRLIEVAGISERRLTEVEGARMGRGICSREE